MAMSSAPAEGSTDPEKELLGSDFGPARRRLEASLTNVECEYRLENDPTLAQELVNRVVEQLERMSLGDADLRMRVGVALEEALLNAIYHGNLEVSSSLRSHSRHAFEQVAELRRSLLPYRERRVLARVSLAQHEIRFVVRDEGPGFDPTTLPDPTDPENLDKPTGRGLLLIQRFMDEVRHNDSGNQITFVKRLGPPGSQLARKGLAQSAGRAAAR